MIKDLTVSETLFISLAKNNTVIKPLITDSDYMSKKELREEHFQFIKRYPEIIEELKQGKIIETFRSDSIFKSILGKEKIDTIFTGETYLEAEREVEGYTIEEAIEKLEFSMYDDKEKKSKRLFKDKGRYIREM